MNKVLIKYFAKFPGKHLCCSLFLNKAAGFRSQPLLNKMQGHMCFPVNFEKFLSTPSARLLRNHNIGFSLKGLTISIIIIFFSIYNHRDI